MITNTSLLKERSFDKLGGRQYTLPTSAVIQVRCVVSRTKSLPNVTRSENDGVLRCKLCSEFVLVLAV